VVFHLPVRLLALSFTAKPYALRKINVGTAYAIWSGVGTSSIAIIGFIWFGGPITVLKMLCIVLILIGVVGLNLLSKTK
jgi:multidrug transporter EmrE-like cation transporter